MINTCKNSLVYLDFVIPFQPIPPEILASCNSAPSTPKTPITPIVKPGRKSIDTPIDGTKIKTEESDEEDANLVIDDGAGKGSSC